MILITKTPKATASLGHLGLQGNVFQGLVTEPRPTHTSTDPPPSEDQIKAPIRVIQSLWRPHLGMRGVWVGVVLGSRSWSRSLYFLQALSLCELFGGFPAIPAGPNRRHPPKQTNQKAHRGSWFVSSNAAGATPDRRGRLPGSVGNIGRGVVFDT